MDRRERANNLNEALLAMLSGFQARLWTALPAVVQSWDRATNTAVVQLAVQMKQQLSDGSEIDVDVAPILDVPVVFPRGGGFSLTFPIAVGDECLLILAARCIDSWFEQGGTKNVQADRRMHDLSDGFALVGPYSKPKVIANISAATVQLREDDGDTYIELSGGNAVKIVAPGGLTIIGDIAVTGAVVASGEGTFNGGHTVSQHVHGGVQVGGGNTAVPHG